MNDPEALNDLLADIDQTHKAHRDTIASLPRIQRMFQELREGVKNRLDDAKGGDRG